MRDEDRLRSAPSQDGGLADRLQPFATVRRPGGHFSIASRDDNVIYLHPLVPDEPLPPPSAQEMKALRRLLCTIGWFAEVLRAHLIDDERFVVAVYDLEAAFEHLDDLPW